MNRRRTSGTWLATEETADCGQYEQETVDSETKVALKFNEKDLSPVGIELLLESRIKESLIIIPQAVARVNCIIIITLASTFMTATRRQAAHTTFQNPRLASQRYCCDPRN
jgi:hypothetical protein